MNKISKQFIEKLEQELRTAYRAQFHQEKPRRHFFRVFLPIVSGAFVIALVLVNVITKNLNSDTLIADNAHLSVLEAGKAEEEIINDFDSNELAQMDHDASLAVAN